jgi:3-isopropylmalate/(R)-2-methylmalate dehydratase small subunit
LPADKVESLLGAVQAAPAARVRVDLEAQTVTVAGEAQERFELCPFQKLLLRTGQDELGYTLALEASVRRFESARAVESPWL